METPEQMRWLVFQATGDAAEAARRSREMSRAMALAKSMQE